MFVVGNPIKYVDPTGHTFGEHYGLSNDDDTTQEYDNLGSITNFGETNEAVAGAEQIKNTDQTKEKENTSGTGNGGASGCRLSRREAGRVGDTAGMGKPG